MRTLEYLKEISDEIQRIKLMASADEIAKLDISQLNTTHVNKTIYGLLTGEYQSKRALEITPKKFNCQPRSFAEEKFNSGNNVTALEKYTTYFSRDSKENKDVFDFIKGKISYITITLGGETITVGGTKGYFEIQQVNEIKI